LIHTPGESFEAHESAAVSVHADTGVVTIPDAHLLFTADFQRKGSDLVLTGDDGHKILVTDYFRHEKQPDLVSPEGALLSASLVELLAGSAAPGQYAQATAPAAQQPVGRVETVSGSATVTRNGVAVDLNVGDLVFQGDVVQTRSDSTLGIGFADGSAFSLKENARMALNEFVYDPNSTSNSALINLVQGTVSFIASQVAKTGNMRVETPTATLGIRGTFVTVDVSSVDGHTVASLGLETNPTTGEQFAGSFLLTNRITGNQVTVNQVNSMFSVSPAGLISESAKPLAMQAIENASFQALSAIAAATAAGMGTATNAPNQFLNDPNSPTGPKAGDPGGPAPGGSPGANPAPTNPSPTDHAPTTVPLTPTTAPDTTPANTGGPTTTPPNPNTTPPTVTPSTPSTSPQHITPTGTVTNVTETEAAIHQIGSFSLLEHVSIANPGGSTNYVSGSATLISATLPGGFPSTLTNPAFLSSLLTIAPDGTVGFDRSNFAFLGAGQSLTYAIAFDVQSGSDTLHLTLTLTVNGADGAPTIIIGPADSASATITDDTHSTDLVTHGTLSFKDPDATDAHSVSVAVKSGHAIGTFLAGVLVDTAGSDPATSAAGDIGWVFAANKAYVQSLAAGETDTEVVTITLSDGNGGTVSEDVSITVVGVNDAPTSAAGSTTPNGSITELANKTNDTTDKDQASGTIAFADPDLSDTHTVTQAAPTFTWSGGALTAAQQSALTAASTLTLIKADSTGTGAGSVAWTYKVADNALDFLAAGEKLTITYNVTIDDGHGGTVNQPVTVTVTGTNDAPTIVAGSTPSGSFSELTGTTGDTEDQDQASGTIAFKDVDLDDTHTVSQAAPTFVWSGGTLTDGQKAALTAASTLTLTETDSTHSGAGSVAWIYKVTDSALDFLAAGETLTATYNVTINDGHGGTVTEPVTVTMTGTNDAPVINGGPITVSVQEDGTTRASSDPLHPLTATDPDQTDTQTWSIVGASPTHAPDYQFKIDEFKIVKNSGAFFDDTFTGNPPPSAPSGFSYFVTGTIPSDGTAPGALLNGNNAGFGTGSPTGDPFFGQYATLNTNTDSSDSIHGLKSNSSFTVSGLFDLTLPQEDRNAYGIRLTDRTSSQAGDDVVELRVVRDSGGIERVQLREIDFGSHITTVLQSFTLSPGSHNQILLFLTNDSANTGVIHASFELEQNGVLDSATLTNFTATGTIFNNENWTRAQFFAEAPEQSDSVYQGTYGQLDVTQAGAWTYQLANGQANVQALAVGQTVQDHFTVQVADGHGGFDTKTITVNVTGTNDNAIISVGSGNHDTGAVTEDAHESGTETTSGTLSFSDVDLTDHHSVTGVTASDGALGTLTASVTHDSNGTGTGGVLTWNYSVADSAIDYLAAGQTKVETFTVSVFDGTSTVTKDVTVTITGTNDNANISVGSGNHDTGAVTEDAHESGTETTSARGTGRSRRRRESAAAASVP
jgi:VCBS repeat-containing protein